MSFTLFADRIILGGTMTLLNDAIRFFGTTLNPKAAGYITPDGLYLDFSGTHLTGKSAGLITIHHYDFRGTNTHGYTFTDDHPEFLSLKIADEITFMRQTGCVRVNYDEWCELDNYASFTNKVTDAQVTALANMFLSKQLIIEHSYSYLVSGESTIIRNLRKRELQDWINFVNANDF